MKANKQNSSNQQNDYDKGIRELINHETDCVNNRMNWLILLHGLLIAGFCQIFKEYIFRTPILPSYIG
jgi:hypothetical protein